MNFYQWLDKWITIYKQDNVTLSTYKNYLYAVNLIKKNMGNQNIDDISELDLQELLTLLHKKNNYSKSTIRIVKLTIQQAFKKALKLKYINENPAEDIEIPKQARSKKIDALTSEDKENVISVCKKDIYGDYILFLFETGLRKAEIIELKWENYNSNRHSIFVEKSKSEAGIREIPLTQLAEDIIKKQSHINEYIFLSKNNKKLSKTIFRRLCNRIDKSANVHLTPHICRHTFATNLFEADAPPLCISELLGHKSVAFTMQRYITDNLEKKARSNKITRT